jgi:hypothetical protein
MSRLAGGDENGNQSAMAAASQRFAQSATLIALYITSE